MTGGGDGGGATGGGGVGSRARPCSSSRGSSSRRPAGARSPPIAGGRGGDGGGGGDCRSPLHGVGQVHYAYDNISAPFQFRSASNCTPFRSFAPSSPTIFSSSSSSFSFRPGVYTLPVPRIPPLLLDIPLSPPLCLATFIPPDSSRLRPPSASRL